MTSFLTPHLLQKAIDEKRELGSRGNSSSGNHAAVTENPAEMRDRIKVMVLSKRIEKLVDDAAFFELADKLQSTRMLSYEAFLNLSNTVPTSMRKYFTPSLFLTLSRNEQGQISTEDLLRFMQRSIDVEATLIHLLRHAQNGLSAGGFITEKEFERYIFRLIPEISGHDKIPKSFYPYYVFTASRRFFFFLDPRRTQRINIKKLGHSTVMEELLYMKRLSQVQNDISPGQISTNWFSGANALKLYSTFLDLDRDQSGLLTVDEMLQFAGTAEEPAQLTRIALERIFEANLIHSPAEMDYKAFLDLCLAIENKTTVESLSYFWRAFDLIDKSGRLSPATIMHFYKGVYDALRAVNYDAPSPANIVVEVFDILGCNDQRGPTFKELVNSGQGHVVFSLLLDCGGFWNYDNRESLMQQSASNSNSSRNSNNDAQSSEADDDEDFF